jgi:hypothetical protein
MTLKNVFLKYTLVNYVLLYFFTLAERLGIYIYIYILETRARAGARALSF